MSKRNATFKNELGNVIEISISEKEISDIPGIVFTIAGPDSDIEVHITRREAEYLSHELQEILKTK